MKRSKPSTVVGGGEMNRDTSSLVSIAKSDGASDVRSSRSVTVLPPSRETQTAWATAAPPPSVPQTTVSPSLLPQTMLSPSPELPQTMLSPLSELPQTMLSPVSASVLAEPHTTLSAHAFDVGLM